MNKGSYEEFRQVAANPPKTEQHQRAEIERALDCLTQRGDFWSLEMIREITSTLAGETAEARDLYYLLHGIKGLSADKRRKLEIVTRSIAG